MRLTPPGAAAKRSSPSHSDSQPVGLALTELGSFDRYVHGQALGSCTEANEGNEGHRSTTRAGLRFLRYLLWVFGPCIYNVVRNPSMKHTSIRMSTRLLQ